MDDTTKLTDLFFRDAERFLKELNTIAESLPDSTGGDIIDRAFRAVHSVKSEASYLGYPAIAGECNKLENLIEGSKSGASLNDLEEQFRMHLKKISILIEDEKKKERESFRNAGTGEKTADGGDEELEKVFQFNEFEQRLIREAKERQENLYRLYCEIDPSEKMVYPRIFLLISNLELKVNVIKTVPEISEDTEPEQDIQIFFSSALEEEEIYRIISIDQIARTELTKLKYGTAVNFRSGRPRPEKAGFPEPPVLRVDSKKFEELKNGIEEVELFARKLVRGESGPDPGENQHVRKIGELAGHIGRVLQRLYLISVRDELERLKAYGENLSDKLGKTIDVAVSGGNFEIDTRFLDILSDVLVHLVRNAVDHGIEERSEREMFQKDGTGHLLLSAVKHEDKAVLQIIDDGKGIAEEEIRERAEGLGIGGDGAAADLLSILTHPGFTTKLHAGDDSGRGYGLDIAAEKLKEIPRAVMRVTSKAGRGTIFTVIIPGGYTNIRLTVTRRGNRKICFQNGYVRSIEPVDHEEFGAGAGGSLAYKGLPVFTEHGRISRSDIVPMEKYVVEMEYLERRAAVLVDEVLFEKEIFERQIGKEREVEPHLYSLSLGGEKDYLVVSPSLILQS